MVKIVIVKIFPQKSLIFFCGINTDKIFRVNVENISQSKNDFFFFFEKLKALKITAPEEYLCGTYSPESEDLYAMDDNNRLIRINVVEINEMKWCLQRKITQINKFCTFYASDDLQGPWTAIGSINKPDITIK